MYFQTIVWDTYPDKLKDTYEPSGQILWYWDEWNRFGLHDSYTSYAILIWVVPPNLYYITYPSNWRYLSLGSEILAVFSSHFFLFPSPLSTSPSLLSSTNDSCRSCIFNISLIHILYSILPLTSWLSWTSVNSYKTSPCSPFCRMTYY